jgi:HAD superfamily phosphatase
VIRDVAGSYRRALAETVRHYSGWLPEPADIDALKGEGLWNNDWEASLELLRRRGHSPLPPFEELVEVFSGFYFGGDPAGDPAAWRGFIGREPLLVDAPFFAGLNAAGIATGFVSGAEPPSARYVLETRLGLLNPALVAMGDAPDKPDPTGLLGLAEDLAGGCLGSGAPPVGYVGDTVADVQTVLRARRAVPLQSFSSLVVAPPHLHRPGQEAARAHYEHQLLRSGADHLLARTDALCPDLVLAWLTAPSPPPP